MTKENEFQIWYRCFVSKWKWIVKLKEMPISCITKLPAKK